MDAFRGPCPWCGRTIILDHDRRVSSHRAPVCAGWERLMQRARDELGPGAAREIGPELLLDHEDDTRES